MSKILRRPQDIAPRHGVGAVYTGALRSCQTHFRLFSQVFLVLLAPAQPGRENRRSPRAQRPVYATKLAIPGFCPGPSRYGVFWGNGKAPKAIPEFRPSLGSGISPLRASCARWRRDAVSRWRYIPSAPVLREWFPLSASSLRRRWRSCRRRARLSARACDGNAPASSVR